MSEPAIATALREFGASHLARMPDPWRQGIWIDAIFPLGGRVYGDDPLCAALEYRRWHCPV